MDWAWEEEVRELSCTLNCAYSTLPSPTALAHILSSLPGRGAGLGLRGRGGFRGRGMGKPEKIPTKEELDNQLDNYMSMTKSRLDAELDSYMAMAGSDYME